MTKYEMSGEPYSQKSRWIIHSNQPIFQVMKDLHISIHSVVLPVIANIAQCLMGDWERIAVADPEGVRFALPPSY